MGLLSSLAGLVAAPLTGGASLAPMLIGAAAGAGKHFLVDKPAENRSRQYNAEIQRYSPWSGIQAPGVKTAPGLFSSALQGGAMGAMAGQALNGTAPVKTAGEAMPPGTPMPGVKPPNAWDFLGQQASNRMNA